MVNFGMDRRAELKLYVTTRRGGDCVICLFFCFKFHAQITISKRFPVFDLPPGTTIYPLSIVDVYTIHLLSTHQFLCAYMAWCAFYATVKAYSIGYL